MANKAEGAPSPGADGMAYEVEGLLPAFDDSVLEVEADQTGNAAVQEAEDLIRGLVGEWAAASGDIVQQEVKNPDTTYGDFIIRTLAATARRQEVQANRQTRPQPTFEPADGQGYYL